MKRLVLSIALLVLLAPMPRAGVVIEMEVMGPDPAGKASFEKFYAQGEMARMDPYSDSGKAMSVIFRDQAMWLLDHDKKVCQKLDKEGMAGVSAQLDAVMKQMAQLPPEQRAMMEKMMKGKMPGMAEPAARRLETGDSEQVGPYACTLHTLYSDEQKVWESCIADGGVAADLGEAMEAFGAMSRFTEELLAVIRQMPFAGMIETPFNEVDALGGFPVRVREFDGRGKITRESTLKAITPQDLDDSVFAVPDGYKVKDLKDAMGAGR